MTQYMIIVSVTEQLDIGVIFAYQINQIREGGLYFFCNIQEGLEKIAALIDHPANLDIDGSDLFEVVELSHLPEYISCGDNHQITDELKTYIQQEVLTKCILT